MLEKIFTSSITSVSLSVTLLDVLVAIGAALLSGTIVSLTYLKTHPDRPSKNFSITLILLPAVISVIIMLIGSDIARAFSLAGAFSIIRFRSAPGEPKDIALILFSLAAGLAAGTGVPLYAFIFTIILCLALLILHKIHFGDKKEEQRTLQITIPEDLDYEKALGDVLEKYTSGYQLTQVKMTAMGSLYVLNYTVTIPAATKVKDFLDDIRTRNGNLNINLHLIADTAAY